MSLEILRKKKELIQVELQILELTASERTLNTKKSIHQNEDSISSIKLARGPLTETEKGRRVREICIYMNTFPKGESIPSNKIAKSTRIWNQPQACYKWMQSYMTRPECPWRQGLAKMSFILK